MEGGGWREGVVVGGEWRKVIAGATGTCDRRGLWVGVRAGDGQGARRRIWVGDGNSSIWWWGWIATGRIHMALGI